MIIFIFRTIFILCAYLKKQALLTLNMKLVNIYALIILTFALQNVFAQDSTGIIPARDELTEDNLQKVSSLNQEIVSACRTSKKVEDLPMTIYIVTREDIIKNNYITLVDILKTLPGMRVSQPGSGELGEMFLMRGMLGNTYTKILINNVPVKPSVTKGMPIAAQLPIRQAERIEIIYGTASSVYGADAASGVINIITKKVKTASFSQADASIGTHGYSYFNFLVGGRAGRSSKTFDYTVFGSNYSWNNMDIYSEEENVYRPLSYFDLHSKDGWNLNGTKYKPSDITDEIVEQENAYWVYDRLFSNYQGTLGKPDFAAIPEKSNMLGFTFAFKDWNIDFMRMERQTHSSIGFSSQYFRYNDPSTFTGERIYRLSVGTEKQFGNFNSRTNFSYISYQLNNNSSKAVTYKVLNDKVYFYSASDDLLGEQVFTWSKSEKFELTFGASFQYSGNLPTTNDMNKPFKPETYKPFSTHLDLTNDQYYDYYTSTFGNFGIHPVTFGNVATFGQVFYKWRKFAFLTGLRVDKNTKYKYVLNPRTSILYKLNHKHSFRAAWGSAFKEPSTSSMYHSLANAGAEVNFEQFPVVYEYIPNTNLNPEVIETFEFGYRRNFQNIGLDVSLYSFEFSNQVLSVYDTKSTQDTNGYYHRLPVRMNVNNSDSAYSHMAGLQTSLRFFNLYEPLKLKADFTFDMTGGEEVLPLNSDTIYSYRQVPYAMGVASISAEPFKNAYIKISSCLMGPWLRLYGVTAEDFENEYNEMSGYTSFDLVFSYTFGKYLTGFVNVRNLTHEDVFGIDVSGTDADLHHNPQPGRNIRFGITYRRN